MIDSLACLSMIGLGAIITLLICGLVYWINKDEIT